MSGYVRVLDMDAEARPTDKELELVADELLKQVVCDCGNYRHHGVRWMPEGSGEGLSVAVSILRKLLASK